MSPTQPSSLCLSRSSIARALSKGKSPKAFASISGNKTQRHHHKQWFKKHSLLFHRYSHIRTVTLLNEKSQKTVPASALFDFDLLSCLLTSCL
ncbi:hypothetical protein CMV_014680 [Castanea mollissima]|uniref:Uncharacterized protein n=1 Tax=Castanea mollissima TaxID=60419 RepID=A0A8J4VTM7_9ROSI|nr:hypothetical protein CMV_014680 [Castanea mollissima]